MSRLAKRLSLAVAAVLALTGTSGADTLRTPSYRPYIVEVGGPRAITRARLDQEIQVNSDLRSWIRNYGYPDVAEIQEVVPDYGWSAYEVRTFYLNRNQEIAFGRVAFFPTPAREVYDLGLIKYQGPIQSESRQRIEVAARVCGPGGSPFDRILAAADRATRAAEMAEKESLRAVAAAEKAEAVVGRMETGFRASLRK